MVGSEHYVVQTKTVLHDEDISACVPAMLEDAYAFAGLVYNIRHSLFNLPRMMTYSKYRLLLDLMIKKSGRVEYNSLDPTLLLSPNERSKLISKCDEARQLSLMGYLICIVSSPVSVNTLNSLVNHAPTTCSFTDQSFLYSSTDKNLSLTVRTVTFTNIHIRDRHEILRAVASEDPRYTVSQSLLINDISVPLELIAPERNIKDIEHSYDEAMQSRVTRNRQLIHLLKDLVVDES